MDTRDSADGMGIRRRRECAACEYRFSTVEEVELMDVTIVKRDGRREAFRRDKMAKGVLRALEKRPYTDLAFKQFLHEVERDIQKKRCRELTSPELGEIVMGRLQHFDHVAYIRFASVYRQFEDVETFKQALDDIAVKNS